METIAKQVHVNYDTIRRVLRDNGAAECSMTRRRSMADPYIRLIVTTPEGWPSLCASRLYEMVRERGSAAIARWFARVESSTESPISYSRIGYETSIPAAAGSACVVVLQYVQSSQRSRVPEMYEGVRLQFESDRAL